MANYITSSGEISSGIILQNYDYMTVLYGGIANNTTIDSWGRLLVEFGGMANSTTVSSGGYMYVYDYGIADSIVVNPNGRLIVSSGGTATNLIISSGADLFFSIDSETYIAGTIDESSFLIKDGKISGYNIVDSCRWTDLFRGCTIDNATINADRRMYVHSKGIANSVTVNSGGELHIDAGGTATNINWTPCVGHVIVSNGGYATFASKYSGVYYGSDNQLISHAASIDTQTLNRLCQMYVMSGGTANNTTVEDRGEIHVFSGGTANSTTIRALYSVSGGNMYVSSGGTATNIVWTPCEGHVYVLDGGYATFVSKYSGVYYGSDGAKLLSHATTMNNKTLNYLEEMYVFSGGTANSTTVNSSYGQLWIYSGGTANSTTISAGEMYVFSGGTANDTTVEIGGTIYVSAGVMNNIDCRGIVHLSSGGTANIIDTKDLGGMIFLSSGATANSITINPGGVLCIDCG